MNIGNTQVVEVCKVGSSRIFAKLEYMNPTGSHHDRQYRRILQEMQVAGKIDPASNTLIEVSSGNAGASFAYLAKQSGYKAIVIVPSELTENRINDIRQHGAEVIISTGDYIPGSVRKLREMLLADNKLVCLDHSRNLSSIYALEAIGEEVMQQLPEITHYVGVVGSGASLLGPARVFSQHNVKVHAWEPFASAYAFEMQLPGRYRNMYGIDPGTIKHSVYGASFNGVRFPFVEAVISDHMNDCIVLVSDKQQHKDYQVVVYDEELRDMENMLLRWDNVDEEISTKWSLGRTSKGNLVVANYLAQHLEGANILIIFYDKLCKY